MEVSAIPTLTVVRILNALVYISVCTFAYWKLIPRLSRMSMTLATVMLAAQVAVMLVFLAEQYTSHFERWFWHLDSEYNGPTLLASAQLALVAAVMLATACFARAWQSGRRLYSAAIATYFVFIALDEQLALHDSMPLWHIHILLGILITVATAIVISRSPKRSRVWYVCIVAGLALSAFGAVFLEQFRSRAACTSIGFFENGCRIHDVEEALEFSGVWLTLVAALGLFSGLPRPTRRRVAIILFFIPALWMLALAPTGFIAYIEFRFLSRPADIRFETSLELQAYRVERKEDMLRLQLFTSMLHWQDYTGVAFSLHLVDQESGESIVGINRSASRKRDWTILYRVDSVRKRSWMYTQWMELAIPAETPTNRALWLVLTTWRPEGDELVRQNIVASDRRLLSDAQIVLGELVLPGDPIAAATNQLASFDHGLTLGIVELPAKAHAGDTLSISFDWRADADDLVDYTQFLHFVHEESGEQWGYDQQPLGTRLPTRLWYSGLADSEIWRVPVPADLAPGTYELFTGLYRASDLERLPARDSAGVPYADSRVPLGSVKIEQA